MNLESEPANWRSSKIVCHWKCGFHHDSPWNMTHWDPAGKFKPKRLELTLLTVAKGAPLCSWWSQHFPFGRSTPVDLCESVTGGDTIVKYDSLESLQFLEGSKMMVKSGLHVHMSICHSKDGQTLMNRIFRMLPWWLESDSKYLYNHIGLSKPFEIPMLAHFQISAFQPRHRQMRKEKQAQGNGRRWRQRQHRRSANTSQITPPHQLRELA